MSSYISEAFSKFSDRLKRFNDADSDSRRIIKKNSNDFSGENLKERSERLKNNVVSTYKIYKSPFEALGTDSVRAANIDSDENLLFKAYNLYKSAMDLNLLNQDEIGATYIKDVEIFSPLAQKPVYTSGGQFVYLFAWLYFEKNCRDYFPFFDGEGNSAKLKFSRDEKKSLDIHEKEIFRIIEDEFYR